MSDEGRTEEEILRHEFDAEPGSFLLQLRTELRWDTEAFHRMTSLMYGVAIRQTHDAPIPQWIAAGFWYLDWFVRDWSTRANFPRPHEQSYYEAGYERLHDLAWLLFVGDDPFEGQGFDPL